MEPTETVVSVQAKRKAFIDSLKFTIETLDCCLEQYRIIICACQNPKITESLERGKSSLRVTRTRCREVLNAIERVPYLD